jgi:RNA polymerase sigma-70 factor (ECF subfamily)
MADRQVHTDEQGTRQIDPEETELAARAHAGDLEAFGQLVERYSGQARRVARGVLGDPHDGDDAAQDAFLSALRNLGRYDPTRPFGPWLMRIVSNAAVDRRRRNKVRATEALSPSSPTRAGGPAADTDRRAMLQALETGLGRLPERQRIAVTLFDVEGYSHAEIAEILQVPQGTVRSDVFHGRRALRATLRPWQDWKEEVL